MVKLTIIGGIYGARRDTDRMINLEVMTPSGKGKIVFRKTNAHLLDKLPLMVPVDVEFDCEMDIWGNNMMLLPQDVTVLKK